jgi:hypothetical protein
MTKTHPCYVLTEQIQAITPGKRRMAHTKNFQVLEAFFPSQSKPLVQQAFLSSFSRSGANEDNKLFLSDVNVVKRCLHSSKRCRDEGVGAIAGGLANGPKMVRQEAAAVGATCTVEFLQIPFEKISCENVKYFFP